jgi:hypothetical protein
MATSMNAGPKTNTNAGVNAPKANAAPTVPDVSTNPVVRKPFMLDQKVTVNQEGKKLTATITGIQVTYDDKSFLFPTAVLTDDSTIEVAQAGAGRRRTNRRRRSSRRN